MESHYQTLRTLYEIVKHEPRPETYLCRPRELILRLMQDWNIITTHLTMLKEEKLIRTRQLDTMFISITVAGIEKVNTPVIRQNS